MTKFNLFYINYSLWNDAFSSPLMIKSNHAPHAVLEIITKTFAKPSDGKVPLTSTIPEVI